MNAGGNVSPGASVGRLTVTNLTLDASATNIFEFDAGLATNDPVGSPFLPASSTIPSTVAAAAASSRAARRAPSACPEATAGTGAEGPGPLVTSLTGKTAARLRIPILIVPGGLTMEQVDALS